MAGVEGRLETVVDRARRGDRDALGELWSAYQAPLLRFRTATRDRSAGGDATRALLVHRGLARLRRKLAVTDQGAPTMKEVS